MVSTIKLLYKEGGIPRFYRGLLPALVQSPIARFGDTFANAGAIAFLDASPSLSKMPLALKTAVASVSAGGMRICLMPIDAWKTNKQVGWRFTMSFKILPKTFEAKCGYTIYLLSQ